MTVTNAEIGAYVDSLSDIGTPASGDELLIYDVSASTTKKVQAGSLGGGGGSTTFAGVRVTRTTAFSVPNNSSTAVQWDSETFDTDGFHDNATNSSRLTVPSGKAGYYHIWAAVNWVSGATNNAIFLVKTLAGGGSTSYAASDFNAGAGVDGTQYGFSTVLSLAVGDYVEVKAYQASGGAKNIQLNDGNPQFGMYLIGS